MHTPDNLNNDARTSAAQIDEEEDECALIVNGLMEGRSGEASDYGGALYVLAHIVACLTGSSSGDREWAQERVKELASRTRSPIA